MDFYNLFSRYYDDIFRPDADLAAFISERLKAAGVSEVLDIGCATGGYSDLFSRNGFKVSGIDLSENMIEQAEKKSELSGIKFNVLDMRKIGTFYPESKFGAVLILGNTLVHITDDSEFAGFFQSVFRTLQHNGIIFIQLINYDHFIKNKIRDLPEITGESLSFKRRYNYSGDKSVIFNTEITEKISGKKFDNSILINPVRKNYVTEVLSECGFRNMSVFSGSGSQYNPNSVSILISAEK
ncbi:MAG: class I SAM-dependent methyltransferase [Spirochaetes bacterium]|nr:class I SAM-dependent methyltransferase [Spirochaetota bacterium]